jgi:hypothetical protein
MTTHHTVPCADHEQPKTKNEQRNLRNFNDASYMEPVLLDHILFFDLEAEEKTGRIREIGAWLGERSFHLTSPAEFGNFAREATCVCGHNVIRHDLPLLRKAGLEGRFLPNPWSIRCTCRPCSFPKSRTTSW